MRAGDALRLAYCLPASGLPDGATGRDAAFAALVEHIAALGDASVGIDAPFGLPAPLVATTDWLGFVRTFATVWPDPDSFRAHCRLASPAAELKRHTDRESGTPFSAYNLKLYRQTWHVIAKVIAPLVLTGRATAVPMQTAVPERPALLEICPASMLKRANPGLYRSYKGPAPAHRAQRQAILSWLTEDGFLQAPSPAHERRILDNAGGDALDAVIAAVIALRASADPANLMPRPQYEKEDRLEARVYF